MSDYVIDMDAFAKKDMSQFEESFNIVIGTGNKDIDLFNNRYIEVMVNEITTHGKIRAGNIKLRKCDREKDLEKFMTTKVAGYYPNALCFDDKSKINLIGDWFDGYFKNIFISIERC